MARVKQAKKLLDKGMSAASKKIDELLTPSELTKAQAAARRRTGRKIAKEKDPLRAFADSKDPAVRRLRAEKAAEAKARASKTRAGQRRRQAAARKEAVDKRKSQIARGAGATAGATALVGAGTAASRSAQPSKPQSSKPQSSKPQSPRKGTPESRVMLKDAGVGKARTIAEAKRKGLSTFIDKSGKEKAAVTKEELKKSGMTLREYLNKQKANAKKKAGGGMRKSKMASKGGAKGGRMPTGMKKGGSASKFPDLTGDGKVTQKDILKARGVPGFSKGDVVVNMVRELSKLGRRAFEKEYGKAALNKAIKDTNKASGLTPTKAKKTPTQKKLAEADQRAELTKFTRQTPAAKKQSQVQVNEKRMERMKNGGMMKSKMSSKGGAKGGRMPGGMKNGGMAKKTKKGYALGGMTKKGMAKGGAMTKKGMAKGGTNKKRAVSRKPRGVGAALRGFGKALKK